MIVPGTADLPLRVAIVGSGPAGFFVVEHLFKTEGLHARVDMFERLPVPFGLVRFGVAPDHQKIKGVTRVYERVAARPEFRFYGNVEYGTHVTLDDLERHYHQVCFATGAQTDRRLGIPGEDLARSHPATEFVAWYNGHPDFRHLTFDLSVERVAVVGIGNVAVDVARILCRAPEELSRTDIADYALEALRNSRVREVYMLGRRGPAQAAFTNPEIKELGEMPGADIVVLPEEVELDDVSRAELEAGPDREIRRKIEILQGYAARPPEGRPRRLTVRFCVSPVELHGDDRGRVAGMKLVHNRLERSGARIRSVPTDRFEDLDVGMVFRSVGYHGVALPGVPFREDWGTVPNDEGRVLTAPDGEPVPGLYVTGWIKRGPSGVIGTNKPDAGETVRAMLEDLARGTRFEPADADPDAVEALIRERRPEWVSYEDWTRIDGLETGKGKEQGRPRVKFVSADEVLAALGRR